jgi:hypothetical protein
VRKLYEKERGKGKNCEQEGKKNIREKTMTDRRVKTAAT